MTTAQSKIEQAEKLLQEAKSMLAKIYSSRAYRANNNDNWESYPWWFVLWIHTPNWDVSYHLPNKYWSELDWYWIQTTLNAPQWDWHTSKDVIDRLHKIQI